MDGHFAYDIFAAIFLAKGLVDIVKFMGFFPTNGNGSGNGGQIGKLHIKSFEAILKNHLVDSMESTNRKLDEAVRVLERIATILEERR